MRLNQQTNYAIRMLLCLAEKNRIVPQREISSEYSIPSSSVILIAHQLREKGWIGSDTGQAGGYYMLCDPKTVNLLEVILMFENHGTISRCLESTDCCKRASDNCLMYTVYLRCQKLLEDYFASISIADLLNPDIDSVIDDNLKRYVQSIEK